MFNRRRNDNDFTFYEAEDLDSGSKPKLKEERPIDDDDDGDKKDEEDIVPIVYACATMWHETRNEMMQLLKSIFRYDYCLCCL